MRPYRDGDDPDSEHRDRDGADRAGADRAGDRPAATRGAADGVIEMDVAPSPRPRPFRWRGIAALVALIVVAAGGYLIGDHHGRGVARPAAAPSPTVLPVSAVVMTGRTCAVQAGKMLTLGVEIRNDLTRTLMLDHIDIGLPLGMLRLRSTAFGTCGAVGGNTGPQPLAPGNSTWLSATFDVQVTCPGPAPVLFVAEFHDGSAGGKTVTGGFPDLGTVPYTGCPGSGG
jgi:hypothetical protein